MGRRRGAGRFVLVFAFGCSISTGSDDEGGTSAPTTAPTMMTASTSADGTTTEAANCPLGPAPAITAGGSYATTGCGGSGDCEVPPALLEPGCPVDWAGGAVAGETEWGCFHGTQALFGFSHCENEHRSLELHVIDPSTGVRLELQTWWYLEFGWLSRGSMHAYIHDGDQSEFFGGVMVAVDSIAGSWDAYDPLDPPRVQGRIETMEDAQFRVSGTFDAALCDAWIRGFCPD